MLAATNFLDSFYSLLPLRDRATLEQTLFLIPLFPLLGFLLNGLFGSRMDKKASGWIAVMAALASFVWAAMCVGALSTGAESAGFRNCLHATYGNWLSVADTNFGFGLYLDPLSATMIMIVTGIGTLIHMYSLGYMAHDAGLSRFMAYLNLFLFAMILLVLGDNLIMLFVGWEGVGLCSYLLIGFWYEEGKNAAAGMKAFVVNRIGDLGFLLGIFILFAVFGTVDFAARPQRLGGERVTKQTYVKKVPAQIQTADKPATPETTIVELPKKPGLLDYGEAIRLLNRSGNPAETTLSVGAKLNPTISNLDLSQTGATKSESFKGMSLVVILTLACALLFVGACGKSAQIPLFVWLPDAMAGPTPVSALIHAATMVTAGVYMVARLHGLFAVSEEVMMMMAVIGGSTALFSALIGLTQLDIKKVLAYSTVSQLGYMFLGLGVGAFSLGIFHVMTHAFFKALLFLGAGSVIHAMSGEQDMRYMGGLRKKLPVTFITMLIGAIALSGLWPLAGWWSKDAILGSVLYQYEFLHGKHDPNAWVYLMLYVFGCVGAFCTAFYTFRLIGLTFFGENRASEEVKHHIHESPPVMTIPLIVLACLSVVGGFLWHGNFISETGDMTGVGIRNAAAPENHHAHVINLIVTSVVALGGIALGLFMYGGGKRIPNPEAGAKYLIYRLSANKFYVDEIYNVFIIAPFKIGSELLHWFLEMLIIDLIVTGTGYAVSGISGALRRIQTGLINSYAAAILVGALAVLYYLLRSGAA
jgi:NADH-quinone oxidoreductase subunit L